MYKRVAIIVVLAVSLIWITCTKHDRNMRSLSLNDYVNKMKAGWLGQMAGVGWGDPTEFEYKGVIIPQEKIPVWKEDLINQFRQDDIYVEMTFLRSLEVYGMEVTARQAGIDFANSEYRLWHANRAGRDNLRSGIAPPFSGHPAYNSHADDIDYQIEADFSGLISPGLPNSVIRLGETFGRLMNYGDGIYGGQFVGGMYAEAFFETNLEKIVKAGLKCIPVNSLYYQCIQDVLNWYTEYPDNWEKTWNLVNEKYHKTAANRKFSCSGSDSDFNIDAKINGAYIVIGLLYGKGDPDKTIVISMRCGQDSDCNPSNAAGILFTTLGYQQLPDKFIKAIDPTTKFSYTEYNFPGLIEVCRKLAREAVLKAGGRIDKKQGEEIFLIPMMEPVPSKLEQCWDPESAGKNIHYSTDEMKRIHVKEKAGP